MILASPITQENFAAFGQVIETGGDHTLINDGLCKRFNDLAGFEATRGKIGLSLFHSELRTLPYKVDLLERHPLGSQCFIPMEQSSYLVIVAGDEHGAPGDIEAFLAGPHQIVNIARGTWHGVLAPIAGSGLFAVLDRIGEGANLEEVRLQKPVTIAIPPED